MPDAAPYAMPTDPLHVVICHEEGAYIAQCLEHDIAGHGPSIEAAERAFMDAYQRHVLASRVHNAAPFADRPKAPAEYWQMWVQQTEAGAETHTICIPSFMIRHKSSDRPSESIASRSCTAVVAAMVVA